tara:strand:+ start:122 stop:259 length:138 start_codon:yes stop_codon:yes gene_type:complete
MSINTINSLIAIETTKITFHNLPFGIGQIFNEITSFNSEDLLGID